MTVRCERSTGGDRDGSGRRNGEAGFTLVAFVVGIAIMSIFMGVAVQAVSFQMQREREAELVFRGEQYVEAIRLFKMKYGRAPLKLKELWDAKPRVMRKKWKDPFTDSLSWGLIFEGQQAGGGRQVGVPGGVPGQVGGVAGSGGMSPVPTGTPQPGSRGGNDAQGGAGQQRNFVVSGDDGEGASTPEGQPARIGPIVGVHTTSCEESIRVYEGRTTLCEWQFMLRDRQQQPGQPGGGAPMSPGGGTSSNRRGYHAGDSGVSGSGDAGQWQPRPGDRWRGGSNRRPPQGPGITPTPYP